MHQSCFSVFTIKNLELLRLRVFFFIQRWMVVVVVIDVVVLLVRVLVVHMPITICAFNHVQNGSHIQLVGNSSIGHSHIQQVGNSSIGHNLIRNNTKSDCGGNNNIGDMHRHWGCLIVLCLEILYKNNLKEIGKNLHNMSLLQLGGGCLGGILVAVVDFWLVIVIVGFNSGSCCMLIAIIVVNSSIIIGVLLQFIKWCLRERKFCIKTFFLFGPVTAAAAAACDCLSLLLIFFFFVFFLSPTTTWRCRFLVGAFFGTAGDSSTDAFAATTALAVVVVMATFGEELWATTTMDSADCCWCCFVFFCLFRFFFCLAVADWCCCCAFDAGLMRMAVGAVAGGLLLELLLAAAATAPFFLALVVCNNCLFVCLFDCLRAVIIQTCDDVPTMAAAALAATPTAHVPLVPPPPWLCWDCCFLAAFLTAVLAALKVRPRLDCWFLAIIYFICV